MAHKGGTFTDYYAMQSCQGATRFSLGCTRYAPA